jgi:O-antigen/teichoic acid export membrane protein
LTFRNIADSSLRVSGKYVSQALAKILETGTFFALILLLPRWFRLDSQWIIGITTLGYLMFFVFSIFFIKKKISKPNLLIFKEQLKFGGSLFVANLIGFLAGQADKLLIGGKIGFTDLGLYNLYYLSSTLVVINLSSVFINVAFPDFVKFGQSVEFRHKMLQWVRDFSYVMFFGVVIIILSTFALIGEKYSSSLVLIIGFSLLAAIQFKVSVCHSMISALNKRIFDRYVIINIVITIVYVAAGIGLFAMNKINIPNILLLNIAMALVTNMIQNRLIANSDDK